MELLSRFINLISASMFWMNGKALLRRVYILPHGRFKLISLIVFWMSARGWQIKKSIFRQSRIGRAQCDSKALVKASPYKEMDTSNSSVMLVTCLYSSDHNFR